MLSTIKYYSKSSRFQWIRGPKCSSTAACLLGLWVQISPDANMSVSYEFYVLSGRGFFDGPIAYPKQSYRV
jgi:hypothetical protein